jgi:hypothetical protein
MMVCMAQDVCDNYAENFSFFNVTGFDWANADFSEDFLASPSPSTR